MSLWTGQIPNEPAGANSRRTKTRYEVRRSKRVDQASAVRRGSSERVIVAAMEAFYFRSVGAQAPKRMPTSTFIIGGEHADRNRDGRALRRRAGWGTALAYRDPTRYARDYRLMNMFALAALIAYNFYCSAVMHAKVVVLSGLQDLDPAVALSHWKRIEQGLDDLVPIAQDVVIWALLGLMVWMVLLLYRRPFGHARAA
jgi:hypothetical protein